MRCSLAFCVFWSIAGLASAQEKPTPPEPPKETFESAVKKVIDTLTKTGDLLAKVTDEASAKANGPELVKLGEAMQKLQAAMTGLGKPTAEEEQKLKAKYEADLQAAMKKYVTEMSRLATQPYGKSAIDALKPKGKNPADKLKPPDKPVPPAEKPKDP